MGYSFGKKSLKELNTLHKDLQLIMKKSLEVSEIDFGISEGHRPIFKQQKYYAQGRTEPGEIITYIDGINSKGKHNFKPSLAVDIYAFVNNKATWEIKYLIYLTGIIVAVSSILFEEGKITHRLRHGSNFDMDDELLEGGFIDMPHFELINNK